MNDMDGKIDIHLQLFGNFFMTGELLAIVKCDRVALEFMLPSSVAYSSSSSHCDTVSRLSEEISELKVAGSGRIILCNFRDSSIFSFNIKFVDLWSALHSRALRLEKCQE